MREIEKQIAVLRAVLKHQRKRSFLTASSKAFVWDELERLSNERDKLLSEQGVEIQPWD